MLMLKTKKQIYLWAAAGVLGLLLLVLVTVAVALKPAPEAPAQPTETTEQTLPPPSENVFTPMDFGYENGYMTCLTAPSVLGIDVSTHQKQIDWQQVKAAGVEFVMIRIGYRGSEQGLLFEDEWAQRNYAGAKEAGLKVGGYFFSQSVSTREAVEEARYAMEIIDGWQLDMPLVYDWEFISEDSRTGNVDARTLTDCTLAFCRTVEEAGYDAMIYFNPTQSRKQMLLEELTDYGFWLAMYSESMTYEYKVDMWQYTCEGAVPGISGPVDINLFFPYEDAGAWSDPYE